jgi:hypothetical protein
MFVKICLVEDGSVTVTLESSLLAEKLAHGHVKWKIVVLAKF